MDNALLVGLTRQSALRREMSVTANNIANMSTAGFKLERPAHAVVQHRTAIHQDGPKHISFVEHYGVTRDFRPGSIQQTGRPLDVALGGEGFFVTATDAGEERYTRDGRFTLDADGKLVTETGRAVLDDAGGEIILDPTAGQPTIAKDGTISVTGVEVARLGVVRFDDLQRLEKTGEGAFIAGEERPQPVDTVDVRQGLTEGSNVQAIHEITRMIEVQRAYQNISRMISTAEELKKSAIERLGRQS